MARELRAAGLEFLRQGISLGPGAYFRWAGELDPRQAPVTCTATGVAANDVLHVRHAASSSSPTLTQIAPNDLPILRLGPTKKHSRSTWVLVEYDDLTGWVNGAYLACPPASGPGTRP
jgi:hypothetical protein